MSSSLRRLAKDHAALRKNLPPNYLFDDVELGATLPDDLSQLIICVTGADGTPYSQGLWRLKLSMPLDYPKNPPKAFFVTRIFHPNVEEETGAVCLETLKRDWDPKLTLKDILVTISCLLIQPNPDSALNAKAGALIQEDYQAFAKQAKLMTSIHAPIPKHLVLSAAQAKKRGEDSIPSEDIDQTRDDTKENQTMAKSNLESSNTIGSSKKRPLAELPGEPAGRIHDSEDRESTSQPDLALVELKQAHEERPRKSPKHTHDSTSEGKELGPACEVKNNKVHPGGMMEPWKKSGLYPVRNPSLGAVRRKARTGIRRL